MKPSQTYLKLSLATVPTLAVQREESLLVAALLVIAGGYLEAYTWIIHGVFANAQTANMIFL
jgi:uncharacterized membrane protein YoaK (UPF0700 family)